MTATHDNEIATLMFEHARDILLVIDAASGKIVDANEAAELAYLYSRDELLSMTIFDLRAADPAPVTDQMQRANHEGILFQTVHQRRDGSKFPVEVNSRGYTINGQRMLLSVIRDITDRVRFEAEREALIATTRRALELREDFLMIASHELRSPVTNVSLSLQQLLRLLERSGSGPRLVATADQALAEVSRLTNLISTLLDAQQTAGPLVLAKGPVDLFVVVHEVATMLRRRASLAGSAMTIDLPSMIGEWDRLRLEQVFTNLVVNAIKYGRGKPITISGWTDDDNAYVAVRDHGIGVSAADAPRIFEKFERAVPPDYGGLGLGLYITRQLVEAHGGSITVESVFGEGSTFQVALPRAA